MVALAKAISPWYSTMIRFQSETGLRIGELAALRVWDLDLQSGTVRVEHSMSKRTSTLGRPKTQAGYRVVPMVRPAIASLLAQDIADRGLTEGSFVFGGPNGGKLHQDTFRERHFRPAVQKAGLGHRTYQGGGITPHWLRHTAITNMVSMGLTPMQVAAIAGHSDSRVTESIYTHLNPANMDHALDALKRFWRGEGQNLSDDE